jgi:hypothetical protein
MASERQIAANRRNAASGSGPRSAGGKKRSSRNAYRHGLASSIPRANCARTLDQLARKILRDTGCAERAIALSHAYTAAEASFDLARVRQIKVALIHPPRSLRLKDLVAALTPRAVGSRRRNR